VACAVRPSGDLSVLAIPVVLIGAGRGGGCFGTRTSLTAATAAAATPAAGPLLTLMLPRILAREAIDRGRGVRAVAARRSDRDLDRGRSARFLFVHRARIGRNWRDGGGHLATAMTRRTRVAIASPIAPGTLLAVATLAVARCNFDGRGVRRGWRLRALAFSARRVAPGLALAAAMIVVAPTGALFIALVFSFVVPLVIAAFAARATARIRS